MNTIEDPNRQQAIDWSRQIGTRAAVASAPKSLAAVTQAEATTAPGHRPRILDVLLRSRQRTPAQQHAADKLKVNEFMVGG